MSELSSTNNGQKPAADQEVQHGGPPIVFMQESSIFGKRRLERNEWLKHSELYGALSNIIDASHITGLQRVNGMWRIYIDNMDDKIALLNEGVLLRGKRVTLLNTNPNRLDSEQTVRIRVKNIPLSVEDGTITRPIILKGVDVINSFREKLRYNGKLTNCETGDRLINVKATSLQTPLPRTMMFGKFIGRVIHIGQNNETKTLKCGKCLEEGHTTKDCQNEWKCLTCLKIGHRKGECDLSNVADDNIRSQKENSPAPTDGDKPASQKDPDSSRENVKISEKSEKNVKSAKKKENRKAKKENAKAATKQTAIDAYCSRGNQTPVTGKTSKAKNRTPPTPEEYLTDKKTRVDTDTDSDSSESSSNED